MVEWSQDGGTVGWAGCPTQHFSIVPHLQDQVLSDVTNHNLTDMVNMAVITGQVAFQAVVYE